MNIHYLSLPLSSWTAGNDMRTGTEPYRLQCRLLVSYTPPASAQLHPGDTGNSWSGFLKAY